MCGLGRRELTEVVEKPSDQFRTDREETELTAHVSWSSKGAVTSKRLFENVSNWRCKMDLAGVDVVAKKSYEKLPQEKVTNFCTNYPQRKKCRLFIVLWTVLYLMAGASGEDAASLRCNPQLDPVGSIKHCVYLTTAPGVMNVRCYLDGAELPSSSNTSNITVTRGKQTVGILDLYVTSTMDSSNISCRGDGGPEPLPFSNSITIHVARLPDMDVDVEMVNGSLHIKVTLDRPILYTAYSAVIFPGNMSFNISLDSSYDVELLPAECDQYYLVVYATNIAGQSKSEETRIFSRNLTVLTVGVIATAGADVKTIQIKTEQAVCEDIVDLKKNNVAQSYSLHGDDVIEFQVQDNQRLALEVGGNNLNIVTFDVQRTMFKKNYNKLDLHSEFAIGSLARGAFYAIISVNKNTVRLDRSFYFVMNKTEAEHGFTAEHLPRGTYLVQTYDIEKDRQISVSAPANVINVSIPGSPLRLPHRDKHCPLQLSGDGEIVMTCHCSPGLPLEILTFTSSVLPAGTPEISLVKQLATCGETVMFDKPGDASDRYIVVLLYREGEMLILHQSDLNVPAKEPLPPVGVIVGVTLSVLSLLVLIIIGMVVGCCNLACRKKLSRKKGTANLVLPGP